MPSPYRKFWSLNSEVTFLNHGSFGACPTYILERQHEIQMELEANPMDFLHRTLENRLDYARTRLSEFVGTTRQNLVFVTNATTGVNAVLQSIPFNVGDEILVSDQEYNASRNALNFVATLKNLKVTCVHLPYPFAKEEDILDPILNALTPKTKLLLIDHITSATGVILPIEIIVKELDKRGIDTLIDGAHGPGMVPLNLDKLQVAYYTGNCHKWMSTPKGSALLYVRPDKQAGIHPSVISHGYNSLREDKSKFSIQFGWTGTFPVSAWLAVPDTIDYFAKLVPGGWKGVMQYNHDLLLKGRDLICKKLGIEPPCPDRFQGSMVSIPIPPDPQKRPPLMPRFEAFLQNEFWEKYRIEVPVFFWPDFEHRFVRLSTQLYNSLDDYEVLAEALIKELSNEN